MKDPLMNTLFRQVSESSATEPKFIPPTRDQILGQKWTEVSQRPQGRLAVGVQDIPHVGRIVLALDQHIRPELKVIRKGSKRLIPVVELERWATEKADITLGRSSRGAPAESPER